MAAPFVQAVGAGIGGTTTISPAWPAHDADDIGILLLECAEVGAVSLATAAGFVACPSSPIAAGGGTLATETVLTAFWCRATSTSMGAPTTNDPGNHIAGLIFTIRGAKATGDPFDASASSGDAGAGTTTTWPTITTAVADCLVLLLATRSNDDDAASWSAITNAALSSIIEHADIGTIAGNGGGALVASGVKATAGAVGSTTATVVSSRNATLTLAVAPDSAVLTTTGQLPISLALAATAVPVRVTTGSVPASLGLAASAVPVKTSTAQLPLALGLSATAVPVRVTTASLPVSLGLTAATVPVRISTGTLPLTVGLSATATAVTGGTTGQLPFTVSLTATAVPVKTITGTLPVTVGLTATVTVETRTTTGQLPLTVGLAGSATAVRSITGSLPLAVGLIAYLEGDDPSVTEIRHVLVDGAGAPRFGVLVEARALPPADLLISGEEVGFGVDTLSAADGSLSLLLIPSSQYDDQPALYEVTWQGHRKRITVPDLGPVNLEDVEA